MFQATLNDGLMTTIFKVTLCIKLSNDCCILRYSKHNYSATDSDQGAVSNFMTLVKDCS